MQKKQTLILLMMLIWVSISMAQVQIININQQTSVKNQTPIRSIDDKGVKGINVSYNFYNLYVNNAKHRSTNYSRLSIKDFSHLQEVGKPSLPAHIDLVAIPEGATYRLDVKNDVPMVSKTTRVFPALEPARDTEGAPEPKFQIDEAFYNTDQIFPSQSVNIVGELNYRGIRMAMIQICPVQYNPKSEKIYVHQSISYDLVFSGATKFTDYTQHTQGYMKQIANYPLNGSSISKEAKDYYSNNNGTNTTGNSKNYIIITHTNFLAAADSMANWKRQMGYTVEVVSSSNWTVATVKNAVHTRYQNWIPKPDYLLIIGDVGDVPPEIKIDPVYSHQYGTDLYYVCMNGSNDYIPDMAKGRISPSNAANAMLQVQKIINYERNPISDTNFYQNSVNCAQYQDKNPKDSYADRRFLHTSEDIRNYVLSKGYNSQRIYYAKPTVTPMFYNNGYFSNGQALDTVLLRSNGFNWNGNASDIKNSINAGKFFVFHRDHGWAGGSGWAHPYFVNSNINNQLTNGNKLPVVFSINCHTGEFTLSSCFAETFMRKSNGGAVGVVAASYFSYSGNNDGFSIGLFDGLWSNPGLIPTFGNGGIQNPNVNAHSDIVKMGDLVNHGLTRMIQTWGGSTAKIIYTHRLFHYFGDPAMRIWTHKPDSITAIFTDTISCSDTAINITNCSVANAVATVMSNGVLLGRANIINGSGFVPINGIHGAFITITITARNKVPFIKKVFFEVGQSLSIYNLQSFNKCYNDTTAYLEIFPACGAPPYQIQWSTGDTTSRIENLATGTYYVTVTDANASVMNDTFHINGAPSAISIAATVSNTKCYLQGNGNIHTVVNGGVPPYTYYWAGSSYSGPNRNNLFAGNYQLTITDAYGCISTKNYTVSRPPVLDLTTSFTNDLTNNCSGTATAVPNGGTPPYTFLWNDPTSQTTATATGLCKGLVKITISDKNNCNSYRTVYINNSVGIKQNINNNIINITPNPSHDGVFTIEFIKNNGKDANIMLYNSIGQTIEKQHINTSAKKSLKLDLSKFAQGIYYLHISINNKDLVYKLVYQ